MPNCKKMYLKLFNAHTKALAILEEAGQETEEIAMDENMKIIVLSKQENEKKEDE